jgi:hypothetical protein
MHHIPIGDDRFFERPRLPPALIQRGVAWHREEEYAHKKAKNGLEVNKVGINGLFNNSLPTPGTSGKNHEAQTDRQWLGRVCRPQPTRYV